MMYVDWHPIAVAFVMMVLDIITGFAGAAKTKTITSGKMREGLWHKAGFFGLIFLATIWEMGSIWFSAETGTVIPEIPAVGAVCAFVVATEIVSILENLCTLNPAIEKLPLIQNLKIAPEEGGKDDD